MDKYKPYDKAGSYIYKTVVVESYKGDQQYSRTAD